MTLLHSGKVVARPRLREARTVHAILAAVLGFGASCAPAVAAASEDCPLIQELIIQDVACGLADQNPLDDPSPLIACEYQQGAWVLEPGAMSWLPISPIYQVCGGRTIEGMWGGDLADLTWKKVANATAFDCHTEVSATLRALDDDAHATFPISVPASYKSSMKSVWHAAPGASGLLPKKTREVILQATGGASLSVGVGVTASPGTSASSSCSVSGACSSLEQASASIKGLGLGASARFAGGASSTEEKISLTGNLDVNGQDVLEATVGLGVTGYYSKRNSWTLDGAGSFSGSGSATVDPCRKYHALTNKAYTINANGHAVSTGVVAIMGASASASTSALAEVNLGVETSE